MQAPKIHRGVPKDLPEWGWDRKHHRKVKSAYQCWQSSKSWDARRMNLANSRHADNIDRPIPLYDNGPFCEFAIFHIPCLLTSRFNCILTFWHFRISPFLTFWHFETLTLLAFWHLDIFGILTLGHFDICGILTFLHFWHFDILPFLAFWHFDSFDIFTFLHVWHVDIFGILTFWHFWHFDTLTCLAFLTFWLEF